MARTYRAHKRESYSLATEACRKLGLKATKRAFTNLASIWPSDDPDRRWVVYRSDMLPQHLVQTEVSLFPSLKEVINWCNEKNPFEPTPEPIQEPYIPTPYGAPPPNPVPITGPGSPTWSEPTPKPTLDWAGTPNPEPTHNPIEPMQSTAELANKLANILAGLQSTATIDESKVRSIAIEAIEARIATIPARELTIKLPDRTDPVNVNLTGKHVLFQSVIEELGLGHNVFLAGPSGSGKTTLLEQAGEVLGMAVYLVAPPSDPFEVFGYRDANGNYQDTAVWRALHHDGPALLVFDEIDRADAKALCAAHTILGGNGIAVFPHAQVKIPDSLRIGATANTWGMGTDSEYVGSSKLDGATLARFPSRFLCDYDTTLETNLAVSIHGGTPDLVRRCLEIRTALRTHGIRVAWTPRDTFALCRRVYNGISLEESLSRSVLSVLKPDQRAKVGH